MQYFGALLTEVEEEELSPEEQRERKIMKLLLKVKNGTPPMRKQALRQISEKAREFGAGPLVIGFEGEDFLQQLSRLLFFALLQMNQAQAVVRLDMRRVERGAAGEAVEGPPRPGSQPGKQSIAGPEPDGPPQMPSPLPEGLPC